MKRFLFTLGVLVLLCSTSHAQVEEHLLNQSLFFPNIEQYSVSLLTENLGACTGVIINKDDKYTYILSAKHCIGNYDEGMTADNIPVKFHIASADEDLVLIIVDGIIEDKVPVLFAHSDPEIGDRLFHVGYPNWEKFKSSGILFKINKDWHLAKLEGRQGCSGGGIFDVHGRLSGILWGGFKQHTGVQKTEVSIYEPISDIKKFLNKINE